MYITTSSSSSSSLLGATTPKLLSSSPSRTFVFPPSFTPYSSRNSLRSSLLRWSHRLHHVSPLTLRPPIRAVAPAIERFHREIANTANENPFKGNLTSLPKPGGGEFGKFYSLPSLNDPRIDRLPYSIRILLESAIRNCDNFQVKKEDVEKILAWEINSTKQVEIPFKPARVLLQDFTGVPVVVDLACMRDAMNKLGSDSNKINPLVPVDLVIDHSVQVDVTRSENAVQANMELEFQRNKERFAFLKWGSTAFRNMLVVPPGSGIVHQVNLEYLGRVVFNNEGLLYPDSVVGTDSHTTMIDGLGVAGWGVGGIEAEAAMLGQPMSMVLPGVVGFKLYGKLGNGVTATDLVLTVTQILRKHGVVGKFVEFYGDGMGELSLADRATIANMSPEYGATMGFFPVDHVTLQYLKLTGRSDENVAMIESYLRANKLFVDYNEPQQDRVYTSHLELNLSEVEPCISGPKRPHDRVPLKEMKADWHACLDNKVGFKNSGQIAPLDEIVKLKEKYLFRVLLDESNSLGVLGSSGRGLTEYCAVPVEKIDIITAAMGHALATEGGFCTGSTRVIDHQRLSSSGYVFSASLPPYLASAAITAIDILEENPNLITKLKSNISLLRKELSKISGITIASNPESPIVYLRLEQSTGSVKDDLRLLETIAERVLREESVFVVVSKRSTLDKCRLPVGIRLFVSAGHSESDVLKASESLKRVTESVLGGYN